MVDGGNGLNVVEADNFVKDIRNHPKTRFFRGSLINNIDNNKCRNYPAFEVCGIYMCVPYSCIDYYFF